MEEKSDPIQVLVLGELSAARRIAQQLSEAGFEPVLQNSLISLKNKGLPHRIHSESSVVLRQALEEFSQRKGKPQWIHPGVSLWAERPELHIAAQAFGLRVIGPSPRIQYLFQNNLQFLLCAQDLGIPHIALSFDPMHTTREIEDFIIHHHQSFPFVLKAVRGNGRFAVRVIQDLQDLRENLPLWFDQLRWVLGEVMVFPEKYIEGARQLLVPFVRFKSGEQKVFQQVDISLQSHNRRAIEFSPPPSIDPEMMQTLEDWTKRFAEKVDYIGLGALEFLVDGPRAFLVRGLPRLHSGFHLWEKMSGTSALAWQLGTVFHPTLQSAQAAFQSVPFFQKSFNQEHFSSPKVHYGAVLHVLAEDPLLALPRPGQIFEASFQPEIDWNIDRESEKLVTPSSGYLASVYSEGTEMDDLFQNLENQLHSLWISGSLETNENFLKEVLSHPWIREGMFHAGFLDEEFIYQKQIPDSLLFLAVSEILSHLQCVGTKESVRWLAHRRVISQDRLNEHQAEVSERVIQALVDHQGLLLLQGSFLFQDQQRLRFCAYPISQNRWNVRFGSHFFQVKRIEIPHPQQPKSPPRCYALGRGRVHALRFLPEAEVPAHEPLVIIESEGVFIPHAFPRKSRVKEWKIEVNQRVEWGDELAVVEILS